MPTILDGKTLAASIRGELHELVIQKNLHPCLAILTVGDDPASAVYVRNKKKACDEIGIECRHIRYNESITQNGLKTAIRILNHDPTIHGIIVQLPLPKHLDTEEIKNYIWRSKDVDGFGQDSLFHPCTPEGIIRLLDHYLIPIEGQHAVILGRSNIVGKPLAKMLLDRNATVTVCHSKTPEYVKNFLLHNAHIVIAATGVPNLIELPYAHFITYVDVGINRDKDGKICGDIPQEVKDRSQAYTPVPGGIGPMTVAMLMEHVVQAAVWQQEVTNDKM